MSEFRGHKYVWEKPFGSVRHHWELRSAHGGMHFHVSLTEGYGASCGLEVHSVKGQGAPDHINCPITGGRCWHDGTSLYAADHLWPLIEPYLRDGEHTKIFAILEEESRSRFERGEP